MTTPADGSHLTRHLTRHDVARPRALVLVLHGGKPRSTRVVDGRSASWQRMAAMQRALRPAWQEAGLASWLLRYRARGWNDGAGPVADARAALDHARRELGEVPVVLLGHSMGARVAVHVAHDPAVVAVVGLAPWWSPEDPVSGLRGRRVVAAHGRRDRITSQRMTAAYLDRARAAGADAELIDMGARGHYMISGARAWSEVTRDSVLAAVGRGRSGETASG